MGVGGGGVRGVCGGAGRGYREHIPAALPQERKQAYVDRLVTVLGLAQGRTEGTGQVCFPGGGVCPGAGRGDQGLRRGAPGGWVGESRWGGGRGACFREEGGGSRGEVLGRFRVMSDAGGGGGQGDAAN